MPAYLLKLMGLGEELSVLSLPMDQTEILKQTACGDEVVLGPIKLIRKIGLFKCVLSYSCLVSPN